ncbi:hypothetical protein ACFY1J_11015 [Streptomyces sp. NPDC001406]|uniref:hypothetical protein n=1 Tax=Streptomyces sp. NPDC001406 TaxID=3364572 RepID=UPI0036998533
MKAGQAGREESLQPEVPHRRLGTEVQTGGDLWLAYGQAVDTGFRGECLDGLKTGRLDLAVIADDVLIAGVVAVFVTVGGVVLGDAVDVGQWHSPMFPYEIDNVPRNFRGREENETSIRR